MNNPPRVSVLMPVYNAERYVDEAVRSVLAQTFGDFEFLIVDDGSTDGSRAILERHAAVDARIRLVSRENTGYLVALNEMLGRARGELVARMDADDVSMPGRFERQAAYLDEHPECVMVGSRVLIIDPEGRPLTVMGDALTHEDLVDGLLGSRGQLIYHPAVMFRRQAVDRVGAYRDDYYLTEDMDLFLRLAEVGRIVNLPEPLLKYREHLAKVGRARAAQQERALQRTLEDAYRRRGLEYRPAANYHGFEPPSKADVFRTWGWWALMSGHVPVARRYAAASLARTPFDPASWKLFLCAIRGR